MLSLPLRLFSILSLDRVYILPILSMAAFLGYKPLKILIFSVLVARMGFLTRVLPFLGDLGMISHRTQALFCGPLHMKS